MIDIISELSTKFEEELQNIKNSEELENIRVSYLGKKGSVTAAMKEMGKLSVEEKKEFGQKINVLKNTVADKIAEKKEEIVKKLLETTEYVSFEMHYHIEPELIGGMVVRIGDRVVDSSIRTKIAQLSREMQKIQLKVGESTP